MQVEGARQWMSTAGYDWVATGTGPTAPLDAADRLAVASGARAAPSLAGSVGAGVRVGPAPRTRSRLLAEAGVVVDAHLGRPEARVGEGVVQPGTGLFYLNDVGQDTWEKIDKGVAGANYGWPVTENATGDSRFQNPLYAYNHGKNDRNGAAITGGASTSGSGYGTSSGATRATIDDSHTISPPLLSSSTSKSPSTR